jgi:diguanylate cyclase (GGDEF)-like protein
VRGAGGGPWLARPVGRWAVAAVAGATAAGVVVVGSVPVAFAVLAAANLLVAGVTALLVRRGPASPRVGRALPVAMLVGAVLNLGLAAYVGNNPEDLPPTLLDPFFLVLLPAMVWSSVRTWWSTPGAVPLTTVRRDLLDGLLVTAGVGLVYVQAVLPALGGGRALTPGAALATAYVAGTVLVVAPLVLHWWQSREPDDGWFAAAGLLFALGTAVQWAALAGGTDTRVLGAALLAAAVLVVPAAAAHPGCRRSPAPARVLSETPAAVVVHFVCWVAAFSGLVGHPVRVATVVLATLTMALVLARVLVVRQAQNDLIDRLGAQAATDPLTGLANRRSLDADLAALQRGAATGRAFAVVMVDVDHFKQFNDRNGHAAGDEALRAVARALEAGVRAADRVYRYGGEEFSLLLADVDRAEAHDTAERVRTLVEQVDVPGGAGQPGGALTVSIGVALAPTVDPGTTLQAADRALYDAKSAGRNRVVITETVS